jgi:hypothetical protein
MASTGGTEGGGASEGGGKGGQPLPRAEVAAGRHAYVNGFWEAVAHLVPGRPPPAASTPLALYLAEPGRADQGSVGPGRAVPAAGEDGPPSMSPLPLLLPPAQPTTNPQHTAPRQC